MLKISIVESRSEHPLILAGKQLGPWVTELRTACERARAELGDRELVIDLMDVTAISVEAENVLLQLMNERVKFRCGVFTKRTLRQLARRKQTVKSQK